MSSKTPKGRTILVSIDKKNILKGGTVADMIESALKTKGYSFAEVNGALSVIEIDTRAGNTWYGKIPALIAAKITQSSRAVARPKTMKPFAFSLTLYRNIGDIVSATA